ncbi:NTP transferase domain-containing protein [Roseibium sp.]|uniref:NTP transferase domain-containing protein n=1 Tax=Roseibium sp. TaxID=1936156 RepID=UPI003A977171
MKFGPVPTAEAEGCTLAHSTRLDGKTLKKGRTLTKADVEALSAHGIGEVVVACREPGDVDEDTAAARVAKSACGPNLWTDTPFTGRVNLYAEASGLLMVDRHAVDTMNRIDPALTIATLPEYEKVAAGRMVATAKIIPFAVADNLVSEASSVISRALRIAPFRAFKVGLIATKLDHLKPATMDKTRRVLEQRLKASNSTIVSEKRVAHTQEAVANAIRELTAEGVELLILFGASAVVDRHDVLPAGIERAGGTVTYFGMPVDPGNLLLLAKIGDVPVLGAPGCARSPKENGFDWILDRLLAGLEVTPADITGLGVGGLLMEIGSRPQLREKSAHGDDTEIAAIILGAGKSSRMGPSNKLLEVVDGSPLVAHAAKAATEASLSHVVLVTGHMADAVEAAASVYAPTVVHNPDFADGMASSIRVGLNALPPSTGAAIIMLADMPGVTSDTLRRLVDAYRSSSDSFIIAASANGKRGNPVLWDMRFFPELLHLHGDIGARHIIAENRHLLKEVDVGESAHIDLDTPEALQDYRSAK